jgi:hypothetical protein
MLRWKSVNQPHGVTAIAALFFALCAAGCGVSKTSSDPSTSTTSVADPQNYLAPYVYGTGDVNAKLSTFSFDVQASTFGQTTYNAQTQRPGPQILNAGSFSAGQRGLLDLTIDTAYVWSSSDPMVYTATPITEPEPTSISVQLADKSGGFVQLLANNGDEQLVDEPVAPIVAATNCPSSPTAQTYLFVTIPNTIPPAGGSGSQGTWDPTQETAYGSVDISASGSAVNLANLQQLTLGGGTPTQPASSSLSGICGPTYYGNTIEVPGQVTITNPGASSGVTYTPQATIGIGSSGLLVEDNDSGTVTAPAGSTNVPLTYENALGAGTGAVGLPKPSPALDTSAVVGAQYLGFIYSPGVYTSDPTANNWSSHLASFGFATVPSTCASVATSTSTLIYGGSFTSDDPSTSTDGFGNCNSAIDLGAQTTNGLYPNATVYGVGDAPFQAVAIAGQLNGKYAIFLIGVDTMQPWSIYLLQSN